jgi:hypothetical protein
VGYALFFAQCIGLAGIVATIEHSALLLIAKPRRRGVLVILTTFVL